MNPGRIRKALMWGCGSLALLLALPFLLTLSGKDRTRVGFYGISPEYRDAIQHLSAGDEAFADVDWRVLSEEDVLSRRLSRKTDLLISYNGFLTDSLAHKAIPLPVSLSFRFPRSIQGSSFFSTDSSGEAREFRIMPILLNHYETAYFEVLQKRSGLAYPRTLEELVEYAATCREWVETPMVCAGGNDENLFMMISLLAESLAGAEGYNRLVHDLRDRKDFNQTLDLPIGGNAPGGATFGTLLDILKEWQTEGLLLPDWYDADDRLVTVFMEDNHAALVFMSLEEHRRKPFQTIKYFQANPFPSANGVKEATVEPAISALCFRDTEETGALLDLFSSGPGQEALSAATQLAPATMKGVAFDIQADDARYFAAASLGGPVPGLGRAVFLKESDRTAIALQIRNYLSQP